MARLADDGTELHLLMHFPDVLREFASSGSLIINDAGIFLVEEEMFAGEMLRRIELECSVAEWIVA